MRVKMLFVYWWWFHILNSTPGDIKYAMPAPGVICTGIAWDGKWLWVVDQKSRTIFKLREDGSVVKSLPAPSYWPTGLTFDGKHLWLTDERGGIPKIDDFYQGFFYKIDTTTGKILQAQELPFSRPMGVVFDGKYFWTVDEETKKLVSFNANDGTAIVELSSPAPGSKGLAFDGKYFWVANHLRNEIYMVDPENGYVLNILEAPGEYVEDITYANNHLWVIDSQSDSIYKIILKDGQKWKRSKPKKVELTFINELYNFGSSKVLEANFYIALPENSLHQEIEGGISYFPTEASIVKDEWGQRVVNYQAKNIEPGQRAALEMNVKATLYDVRYFFFPEKAKKPAEPPADIKKLYLRDDEKFDIKNPIIQQAIKEAIGSETDPFFKAWKIFIYIIQKMHYERSGGWNPAPTVLARGSGSCSEYSFVFVAMCRAAGIPARFAGSVAKRGEETEMDDIFHRWVEIYLPEYGWIPVDPSGGDQTWPADVARYFGHVGNGYLITTLTGGFSPYLDWNYNGYATWTTESGALVFHQMYGEWDLVK